MSDIKVYGIWVHDSIDFAGEGTWSTYPDGSIVHSVSKGIIKEIMRRTNRTDERFRIAVVNDDGRPEFEKAVSA